MKKYRINLLFTTLAIAIVSCVPQRKLEEEQTKRKNCETELAALKTSNQSNETQLKELKTKMADDEKALNNLRKDSARMGTDYTALQRKYEDLNGVSDKLLNKYNRMLESNISDTKKISGELQSTQEELLKKQDELRKLEKELNAREQNLNELKVELQKREARVNELESILKKKDQDVADLKKKVSDALLGFENKGLTITQKNGKVYVSLDESLLFASGSTKVEDKGVEALKKLAKVLEQETDINVLVEGHTDDVAMKGTGEIKDNWDLSVMRATSIVKIITGNSKINPVRLTASGRGEYLPIDPAKNADARKKNRRTEIILVPKLDELLKVLETN